MGALKGNYKSVYNSFSPSDLGDKLEYWLTANDPSNFDIVSGNIIDNWYDVRGNGRLLSRSTIVSHFWRYNFGGRNVQFTTSGATRPILQGTLTTNTGTFYVFPKFKIINNFNNRQLCSFQTAPDLGNSPSNNSETFGGGFNLANGSSTLTSVEFITKPNPQSPFNTFTNSGYISTIAPNPIGKLANYFALGKAGSSQGSLLASVYEILVVRNPTPQEIEKLKIYISNISPRDSFKYTP